MSKLLAILFLVLTTVVSIDTLQAKVYDFTEGNQITLLQDARNSAALKLDLVRSAKSSIHIMTYYWDKKGYPVELLEELKKAHQRGVDIRIITTSLPTLAMDFLGKSKRFLFSDNEEEKSEAVLSFLKMSPGQNESFTNNIHEKVFLVDGKTAIIGGRNISDAAFKGKDLEVQLEGPVVTQVQEHFQKMFLFLTDLKKSNCIKQSQNTDNDWPPTDGTACVEKLAKQEFKMGDKKFFPEQPTFEGGAKARVLTNEVLFQQQEHKYFGQARFAIKDDIIDTIVKTEFKTLRGYNYFVIPTARYKKYLEDNIKVGKDIRIITNSLKSSLVISDKGYLVGMPDTYELVSKGLNVHQWTGEQKIGNDQLSYLHEKVMLFDNDHGFVGSHNFGSGSTSVSSEITLEFYSESIVKTLSDVFDHEYETAELTKAVSIPMLNKEINENSKMIKFLRMRPFRTLVKELY